jgi:hypothetical protein
MKGSGEAQAHGPWRVADVRDSMFVSIEKAGSGISVFFLASGVAGLELLGAQDYVQELFYGFVLIVAVVISRLVNRRRQAAVHAS